MNLFILTSAVLLVLGLAIAYSQRVRWLRWTILLITLTVVPSAYLIGLELLGRPKPVTKEYFTNPDEVIVLGYKIVENVGIYFLLDHDAWLTPIHYFVDWETGQKMVQSLQDRGNEGKATGKLIRMIKPFDPSWTEDDRFKHPDPPQRDPNKDE